MLAREPIRATEAQHPSRDDRAARVRCALDLLDRASSDWRNGDQFTEGALHWPVSVSLARRALREALEVLEPQETCHQSLGYSEAGRRWYNGLTPERRAHWHKVAGSSHLADCWEAWNDWQDWLMEQQSEHAQS